MSNEELSYKSAGVDTHKGQEFIKRIKDKHISLIIMCDENIYNKYKTVLLVYFDKE